MTVGARVGLTQVREMGRTVARHVLQARVLQDAVSDVWYARHAERPSQRAVVRLITPGVATDNAIEACLAEARAASGVVHGNIVRVHAVGDAADPYVLSRFAPITPLAAEMSDRWTVDDAVELLGPLGDALDVAADGGIPHGAVHGRSVWIDDRRPAGGPRKAVLSGFGLHHLLARVAARDGHRAPLDDFLYVAPELLRGASPSNRSDQYALAAAIHHAITGRPPFQRRTLAALFGAHMFANPPQVRGFVDPDAGHELEVILARGLAKDPDDRFDRCDALVTALEQWCDATSHRPRFAERRRAGGPTPLPVEVLSPGRRRGGTRIAIAAALVTGVAAVGLAAASLSRDRAPDVRAAMTTSSGRTGTPESAVDTATPGSEDPHVRWRGWLDGRPTAVHVAPAGLLVEAGGRTTLIDPATGEVRGELSGVGAGVVAAGDQFVSDVDGRLRSVDVADGSVSWEVAVDPASRPTAFDDTVYGISDATVPQLIATDAGSGRRLWAFPSDELTFPSETAVAPRDDFVYLADDTTVYGILPTGATAGTDTPLIAASEPASEPLCLWRHEVDGALWTGSLMAVGDGVVVAGRDGTVCLRRHADGVPIWCVPVDGVRGAQPTVYDAGDRVVVVTAKAVTALDARTGAQLWRQRGPWRRTVRDGDRLVAIEGDGGLATVSLVTGTVRRPVAATVQRNALLAVDDDVVYAAQPDGSLVAVEVPAGLD